MIRRPPRSTQSRSSAASDVYKRQGENWEPLSTPCRPCLHPVPPRQCESPHLLIKLPVGNSVAGKDIGIHISLLNRKIFQQLGQRLIRIVEGSTHLLRVRFRKQTFEAAGHLENLLEIVR